MAWNVQPKIVCPLCLREFASPEERTAHLIFEQCDFSEQRLETPAHDHAQPTTHDTAPRATAHL